VPVAKGVVVKHDPDDQSNKRAKSEEHEDDTTAPAATSSSLPVVDENKHREEWRKKYNIPPPPLAPPSAYAGQTLPAPPPAPAATVGRQHVGTTQQPYSRGNVSRDASRGATGNKWRPVQQNQPATSSNQPAPAARDDRQRSRSKTNRPRRVKDTPDWMRDPLPPDVLEQRREDFREFVNENLQRALSLVPASMPWGQSQLERNRIELLARTEAFQGGHIARITEYQRFMAQRETALSPRINDEILMLLRTGRSTYTNVVRPFEIDENGWVKCIDIIDALLTEHPGLVTLRMDKRLNLCFRIGIGECKC
jgi:hypothetical protein